MGKIGQALAERARGFGLRLVYTDPQPCPPVEDRFGVIRLNFPDLLQQSDFISLHTPLTAETRGLINREALRSMKPSAILVNTSRGPVVDTQALLQALQEGWIAGAALDVTDPEPLPPEHPLFKLTTCLIVPHRLCHLEYAVMAELPAKPAGWPEGERLPHCAIQKSIRIDMPLTHTRTFCRH
jgi:phosphoglycerate dehydrogenase-like enzyme